jgi:hypothetical protein
MEMGHDLKEQKRKENVKRIDALDGKQARKKKNC